MLVSFVLKHSLHLQFILKQIPPKVTQRNGVAILLSQRRHPAIGGGWPHTGLAPHIFNGYTSFTTPQNTSNRLSR